MEPSHGGGKHGARENSAAASDLAFRCSAEAVESDKTLFVRFIASEG